MVKGKPTTVLALLVVASLAVSCADDGPASSPGGATGPVAGRITVFAAASLTDSFNEIATAFKAKYPGVEVTFNFGGSPTLRTQLEQGARADVFASADQNQMNRAVQNGAVASPGQVFVRNSLVVVTPKDNPGKINSLADLRKSGLKLVLAAPEVPVGAYARQALTSMDKDAAYGSGFSDAVLKNVVSLESNVKQVVAKVELGEADAGIVYGTDVTPSVAPKLATIAIPSQFNVIAEYPIALTKSPRNTATAQAFIDFVLSSAGQTILKKYNFQTVG
jgi:molybdate transport system substrate-binding protein